MIRLLSDENFRGRILRGLSKHFPELDVVRVQDVGLMQSPDTEILEWAGRQGRVLLTHDLATVPPLAYRRVAEGKVMPGVFIVQAWMSIRQAIAEISYLSIDVEPDGWRDQVLILPL